ncbi:MAG: hypothetical protein DYH17_13350 [Xanthomonadales bacterium PRO6]|nr:hypothetical protein [Xanthomonadales bacterium]MCE7932345.1 hypothetical protein [Xanthomonadales bacterium PRO6]
MARPGGLDALREPRSREELWELLIVVLTTSGASRDLIAAHLHGANPHPCKPHRFSALVGMAQRPQGCRLECASLPNEANGSP